MRCLSLATPLMTMDYPQQSTIISVVIRGYATNNKCKGNPQNTTLRAAGRQGSGAANGRRRRCAFHGQNKCCCQGFFLCSQCNISHRDCDFSFGALYKTIAITCLHTSTSTVPHYHTDQGSSFVSSS